MSTIQATNFKHNASASNNIVLDSSGNATFAGTPVPASSFLRNRIINGAMRIDQRNNGSSVTVGPSLGSILYTLDRWFGFATSTRTFTVQRSTTAPAGFVNSAQCTVGVSGSPSAAEQILYGQSIEGFNTADLGWGTANAQTVTISFWVRSSITGTYGFAVQNSGGSRSYVSTYTINVANTWEYKTITVPGDTSGTWLTDNSIGAGIRFDLGSGSNYNATANTWSAGFFWRTSGSINWIANAGATWNVTGVQFEVGSIATPFERRQYTQELALCQRYYQLGHAAAYGVTTASGSFNPDLIGFTSFNTTMRATPTITRSGVTDTNGTASISPYVNGIKISFDITTGNVGGTQFDFAAAIEL